MRTSILFLGTRAVLGQSEDALIPLDCTIVTDCGNRTYTPICLGSIPMQASTLLDGSFQSERSHGILTNTGTTDIKFILIVNTNANGNYDNFVATRTCPADFSYEVDCSTVSFLPDVDAAGFTHSWDFGDGNASTEAAPAHTYTEPGNYTVTYTLTDDCGEQMSVQEVIVQPGDGCTQALTCPCEGPNAINIDAGAGTLVSTLLSDGTLASNIVLNTCMAIKGRLIVDVPLFGISGGEVKMQPGASIVVNRQRTLVLANINADVDGDGTAGIHGCGQLWEGIIAQSGVFLNPDGSSNFTTGGYLQVLNSRLQDAVGAVQLNNRALFRADNNVFDRNHIGILVPPSANGSSFVEMPLGPITQNTFSCSGSLLAPYSGQPTLTNTWGKSGIEVHDCKIFEVGTLQRRNTFTDTERGIYASNSAVRILNATMHDMRSNPYNPADVGLGIGVHAAGRASVELRRSRLYNLETAVFGLEASITGIENSVGRTPGATPPSGHVGVGFDIKPYRNARTVVDDNFIYARQYGIRVRNAAAAGELRIAAENNITMVTSGSTEIPSGSGAAISLEDGLDASPINRIKVFSNIVTLQQRSDGIALYSVGGAEIFDNEIGFTSSVTAGSKYGIYLQGSNHNYLYDNRVAGAALTGNHHGIYVRGSVGNRLCCNTLDGTSFGMYFDGYCDGSRIRHNTFSGNSVGLVCFLNTRFGAQLAAGNQWTGSFSAFAAAHYSEEESDIIGSRIFVAPPPGSSIWPTNVYTTAMVDWFFPGTQAPTCATDATCTAPAELLAEDEEFARKVAQGGFQYGDYPATSQWEAARALHRSQSQATPAAVAAWDADLRQYYLAQGQTATPLYKLAKVEAGIQEMYPADASAMDAQLAWAAYSYDMGQLDSLFHASGVDTATYIDQRAILSVKLGNAYDALTTALSGAMLAQTAQLATLLADNDQTSTEALAAGNQKQVNDLYLKTVASGVLALTNDMAAKLTSVAEQCPAEGGQAVYRARSILRHYDMAVPESACEGTQALRTGGVSESNVQANLTQKQKLTDEDAKEITVYPNPAAGWLTIGLPDDGSMWQLRLINPQGSEVLAVARASGHTVLDCTSLPRGIYQLELKTQHKTVRRPVILQ